ncbi:hypothetical protein AcidC75_21430 [Acidisoma sp. C75]
MPLTPPSRTTPTSEGQNGLTYDHEGKKVIIVATHEAVQDHGWPKITQVASDKYDRGNVDTSKDPVQVPVGLEDF